MLLNEALTMLIVQEAELFSNILLAFLFSGFFFLDLPSWVCVYLLYPATLAEYTSGFRHRLWLLMSSELNLLFLVFLCMIWYYVHWTSFYLQKNSVSLNCHNQFQPFPQLLGLTIEHTYRQIHKDLLGCFSHVGH